jgi:hypothetical protein
VQASNQLQPNLVLKPNVLKVCLIAAGITKQESKSGLPMFGEEFSK